MWNVEVYEPLNIRIFYGFKYHSLQEYDLNASNIAGVVPILALTYLNFSIIRTMKKNNLVHNKICSVERSEHIY